MLRFHLVVATVLLICAASVLTGCGRRGPLELPPGTALPPPRAALTTVTDPASQSNPTRSSLVRDTGENTLASEQVVQPVVPVAKPRTPFILDPLVQ